MGGQLGYVLPDTQRFDVIYMNLRLRCGFHLCYSVFEPFKNLFSKSRLLYTKYKVQLSPIPTGLHWLALNGAPPSGGAGLCQLTVNLILPAFLIPTALPAREPLSWRPGSVWQMPVASLFPLSGP